MRPPTNAELERAGRRYLRDMQAAREARRELEALVVAALECGQSVNLTASLTGLTRLQIRRMRQGHAPTA